MAKSSGGYPVFSGAQSWSHFFGPQNKIVKNLDIGEKKGDQHCAPENTGDQPHTVQNGRVILDKLPSTFDT